MKIFAFPHLQLEQSPLHEHLNNSLHDLETSGIAIEIGTRDSDKLFQTNPVQKEPLGVFVCR
jgi:hypothetical protein